MIYNESYASFLERCLKVASAEDVWIYSYNGHNVIGKDVFLPKGITLEQVLIDMDLSEYA